MESDSLQIRKSPFFLFIACLLLIICAIPSYAQQYIITKKDNTRPETSRQYNAFNLASLAAIQQNGYNEIKWQATGNEQGNKIFIEYSFDGINFLPGEQVMTNNGIYNYRHYIRDTRPLLYRVRTEYATGSVSYSGVIMPEDITVSPVQIQKNIVEGNMINVMAQEPVERVTIASGSGRQLFAKDINGARDFIPIAIPSLDKGIYFITFYGNDWKRSSRFLVEK